MTPKEQFLQENQRPGEVYGGLILDPNCTCDEHGACAYCWNGKKHDGYSDGMTAEDDKTFNRQWDVK